MISEELKTQIDAMEYEDMLRLWRNAPPGHPIFQGKTGNYYATVMARKRDKAGVAEHVRASKSIGWERRSDE